MYKYIATHQVSKIVGELQKICRAIQTINALSMFVCLSFGRKSFILCASPDTHRGPWRILFAVEY